MCGLAENSCSLPGAGSGPWDKKRYMCDDGESRPSNAFCSKNNQGYTATNMAPAGQDFVVSLFDTGVTLQPQTKYSLVVRARNKATSGNPKLPSSNTARYGIGWASNVLHFETLAVPHTPYNTSFAPREVALEWQPYTAGAAMPSEYTITCVTTAANGTSITLSMTTPCDASSSASNPSLCMATFGGLVPAMVNEFTIQARVLGVLSGPSDPFKEPVRLHAGIAVQVTRGFAARRLTVLGLGWASWRRHCDGRWAASILRCSPS